MKMMFMLLCLFSATAFAAGNVSAQKEMCLTAHLAKPVHAGDVTFSYMNQPIGSVSVFGAWLNTVGIESSFFKDKQDFEVKKPNLSVMNNGDTLIVKKFTFARCS